METNTATAHGHLGKDCDSNMTMHRNKNETMEDTSELRKTSGAMDPLYAIPTKGAFCWGTEEFPLRLKGRKAWLGGYKSIQSDHRVCPADDMLIRWIAVHCASAETTDGPMWGHLLRFLCLNPRVLVMVGWVFVWRDVGYNVWYSESRYNIHIWNQYIKITIPLPACNNAWLIYISENSPTDHWFQWQ